MDGHTWLERFNAARPPKVYRWFYLTKKNVKTLKGITKYELIMAEKMFRELNKEPNKDNKIKK